MARVLAQYVPRRQEIRGNPDYIINALENAHRSGLLGSTKEEISGSLRWLPDGRASVWATIGEPAPMRQRRVHPVAREVGSALAKALSVVAAVSAVLVLVFYGLLALLQSVARAVDGRWLVGVGIVLVVLWLGRSARSGHACRGIHCNGCGQR